jgi:hypothetical protein
MNTVRERNFYKIQNHPDPKNSILSLLFILLIFLTLPTPSSASPPRPITSYIPVFIDKLNTGHEVYSADVYLGTDPLPYRLQVEFGCDKIILFKDLSEVSSTYSPKLGGYDYITFNRDNRHYIPVVSDPEGSSLNVGMCSKSNFRCKDCIGVLGLSWNSALYRVFGRIAFSNRYITLGEQPGEFLTSNRHVHTVECKRGKNALCITSHGSISFGRVNYNNVSININPSSQELILPMEVYDEFMDGKNVYDGEEKPWEGMTLRSYEKQPWEKEGKDGEERRHEEDTLTYEINGKDFIFTSKTSMKLLGIKRQTQEDKDKDGNVITIGSRVLRDFIIERNREGLSLMPFDTYDQIDEVNLLFFIIIIILVLRWTIVNIDILNMTLEDWNLKYPWFEIFFEWFGVCISVTSIFLPQTFDLLEGHRDLYIGTWFLLGFSVVSKLYVKVYYSWRDSQNYFIKRFRSHHLRLLNSFLEHVILLTGLWILTLQSRTEGGNSAILFIVNLLLLFITSFYFKLAIYDIFTVLLFIKYEEDVYMGLILPRANNELGVYVFLTSISYAYQALVLTNFFAKPFFIKDLNLQDRFAIPVLLLVYIFTEIVSTMVLSLFISYNGIKFKKTNEEKGEKGQSK